MYKKIPKSWILKTSKNDQIGVKKIQKIIFGSNFILKIWFLVVLVPKIIKINTLLVSTFFLFFAPNFLQKNKKIIKGKKQKNFVFVGNHIWHNA